MKRFHSLRITPILIGMSLFCSTLASIAQPSSPLDIQPIDSKVAQLYFVMLDRDLTSYINHFNPRTGLLEQEESQTNDQQSPSFSNMLEENNDPLSQNLDTKMIMQTAFFANALSMAYSQPFSQYHQQASIVEHIQRIFQTFEKLQTPQGGLFLPPNRKTGKVGSHYIAMIYEALIHSYHAIEDSLDDTERNNYEAFLQKGLQFLKNRPIRQVSHEGMVWTGVMALAYQFTDDETYLQEAQEAMKWLQSAIGDSGELLIPGVLNTRHSTLFLQYLFLYRLMSGDESIDEWFPDSLLWYSRMFSYRTLPLTDITIIPMHAQGAHAANMLGALAYYGRTHTELNQVAMRYLETLMEFPPGYVLAFGCNSFLRGSMYQERPETLHEIPHEPYAKLYGNDDALYYLVGRNYQTAVVLKNTFPRKGMQTWSYQGQSPLLFPTRTLKTHALGIGYDTHQMDIPIHEKEDAYGLTSLRQSLDTLMYQQNELFTGYVFSQDATVQIYHQKPGFSVVDFVMNRSANAVIDATSSQSITFKDSNAKLILPSVAPVVEESQNVTIQRIQFENEFAWFTYAGHQTKSVVQPVGSGLVLVHIKEEEETHNVLLNLSNEHFSTQANFPGTSIPIPDMSPLEAKLIRNP